MNWTFQLSQHSLGKKPKAGLLRNSQIENLALSSAEYKIYRVPGSKVSFCRLPTSVFLLRGRSLPCHGSGLCPAGLSCSPCEGIPWRNRDDGICGASQSSINAGRSNINCLLTVTRFRPRLPTRRIYGRLLSSKGTSVLTPRLDMPAFTETNSRTQSTSSCQTLWSGDYDDTVIPPSHNARTVVLCFDGTGDQFGDDVCARSLFAVSLTESRL